MPHQCTTCGTVFPDGSKEMLSGCPDCGGNKFQFKPAGASESESAKGGGADAGRGDDTAGPRDLTSSAADAVRERASTADSESQAPRDEDVTVSDWVESRRPPEPEPDEATDEKPERGWGEWPSEPGEAPRPASERDDREDPLSSTDDLSAEEERRIRARIEAQEDTSQKSARSDVVSPEELAAADASRRSADAPPEAPPGDAETPPDRDVPTDADGTVIEPESDDRPNLDELREELNDQFESIKIVNPGQYELNLMELYDRDEYIISLREDGRYVIEVPDTWGRKSDDE